MGVGSRQTLTATLPPGQFHCLLDELPLHLIPQRQLQSQCWWLSFSPRQLFLNPQCSVLPAGRVPAELEPHRHFVNSFNLQGTMAWVRDPATGSLNPFWLGPRLEAAVSRLRAGEPLPASTPADVCMLLAGAGILTPEGYAERRLAEWAEVVSKGSPYFRENGYVPLGHLIHPFNLAALRRYYRHAIRRGAIRLGDEQSSRRYVAHNEAVARFFHHQIANAVGAIVGEAIKPSYVYFASYLSGAELKKHTDRQQCEFSVTLCSGFFSRTGAGNLLAHTSGYSGRYGQGLSGVGRRLGLPGNEGTSLPPRPGRGPYVDFHFLPLRAGRISRDHSNRLARAALAQSRNQIKHGEDLVVAVGEARTIASHNQRGDVNHPRSCLGLQFLDESLLAGRLS